MFELVLEWSFIMNPHFAANKGLNSSLVHIVQNYIVEYTFLHSLDIGDFKIS